MKYSSVFIVTLLAALGGSALESPVNTPSLHFPIIIELTLFNAKIMQRRVRDVWS